MVESHLGFPRPADGDHAHKAGTPTLQTNSLCHHLYLQPGFLKTLNFKSGFMKAHREGSLLQRDLFLLSDFLSSAHKCFNKTIHNSIRPNQSIQIKSLFT